MAEKPKKKLELKTLLDRGAYKEVAPFLSLGWQLIIPILLGFFAGRWLDGSYGTAPLWTLILAFIGIVIGFYNFFRIVLSIDNHKDDNKKKQD
ncbi:MAG: synthase protein [Bacteroidota bacterium]|nr:synthase protein [Bacteroidota bacterium]